MHLVRALYEGVAYGYRALAEVVGLVRSSAVNERMRRGTNEKNDERHGRENHEDPEEGMKKNQNQKKAKELWVCGGATKSDIWMQVEFFFSFSFLTFSTMPSLSFSLFLSLSLFMSFPLTLSITNTMNYIQPRS